VRRRAQRKICAFPEKQMTRSEALAAVAGFRRKGYRMRHYRCPAKGHWHLSSSSPPARRFQR
jgi:hypothetical protein